MFTEKEDEDGIMSMEGRILYNMHGVGSSQDSGVESFFLCLRVDRDVREHHVKSVLL